MGGRWNEICQRFTEGNCFCGVGRLRVRRGHHSSSAILLLPSSKRSIYINCSTGLEGNASLPIRSIAMLISLCDGFGRLMWHSPDISLGSYSESRLSPTHLSKCAKWGPGLLPRNSARSLLSVVNIMVWIWNEFSCKCEYFCTTDSSECKREAWAIKQALLQIVDQKNRNNTQEWSRNVAKPNEKYVKTAIGINKNKKIIKTILIWRFLVTV